MNIIYVNHYAGSPEMGMAYRTWYMAREWQKLGHNVTVVAADFSHLRAKNPVVEKDFDKQDVQGVPYIFIKAGSYVGNGAKRAISMFRFTIKFWLKARVLSRELVPDVVISSSTYPLDTYPCRKMARCSRAALIHEAHDLWPLTLVELGGMSRLHPFVVALQAAENAALRKSDRVVGLLPQSYVHMLEHGLKNKDLFTFIPNGAVLSEWENAAPAPAEHTKAFARHKSKLKVCYLGGHAMSNALDMLLDAAALLQSESMVFILVGSGVEKPALQERVAREGLSNVEFLPAVPKACVPSVLEMADLLYVGAEPCSLYRYGVSMNKLYDYMMSAKPIINAVDSSNNEVGEADCGFTVKPVTPQGIAEAIMHAASLSESERRQLGARGKAWVLENRDYSVLAQQFIRVMDSALED